MADHIETGLRGEAIAAAYLRDLGWEILRQRWCDPAVGGLRTDIDLIARSRDGVYHFVEVKTRSRDSDSRSDYAPESAVGTRKRARMLAAAERYMAHAEIDGEMAVDLCVVIPRARERTATVRYYPDQVR